MIRQFILILLTFIFCLSNALADQLIIEPDMGRKPIIQAIDDAKTSVKLVMYGLTDKELLQQLIQQKKRGRTVNVILEAQPYKAENENKKTIEAFQSNNIAWEGSLPPFRLIHQKTLILDGSQAIVMTFNFTRSTFKNERNFALVMDDPKRVREIDAVFSADWNHQPISPHSIDLIWSPDNSRENLIKLINQATSNIKIYAQNISDYRVIGALAKAARKGVKVEIITSAHLRKKQENYLTKAGVMIHYNQQYYIHAKVFIIDHQKAVIGSINLTRSSLEDNRELSVISRDPNVIQEISATFNNDWKN